MRVDLKLEAVWGLTSDLPDAVDEAVEEAIVELRAVRAALTEYRDECGECDGTGRIIRGMTCPRCRTARRALNRGTP